MGDMIIVAAVGGAVLGKNAVATSLQLPGAQCTPLEITLADRDDIRFLKSLQQRQCLYLEELKLSANKLKVFWRRGNPPAPAHSLDLSST